jgi:hypothetical protein
LVKKRKIPKQVKNANEEPIPNAGIHYTQPTVLAIGQHAEDMVWEVGMIESQIDGYLPISWLQKHNPDINWETGTLKWRSAHCRMKCIRRHISAALITDVQMEKELEQEILMVAVIWPLESQDEADEDGIPQVYQQWAHLTSKQRIEQLPSHTRFDHKIDLEEGKVAPWGPLYPLTEQELKGLREWLDRMVAEGKIQVSKSMAGAPILLVRKANGEFRLCVDYRGLNKVTLKNRYPIPLMSELKERLNRAKIFTKLDLKNGYYLICMAKGDEHKTAFHTRFGLYK